MKHPLCGRCGRRMHRHGKTAAGVERYRCPGCKKTSIIHRPDTKQKHLQDQFAAWLRGKKTLSDIATERNLTRRTLERRFLPLFDEEIPSPSPDCEPKIFILDGTYVHGNKLCVLVAVDEHSHIFWKFAPRERYLAWAAFLEGLPEPEVVVADGQKGLFLAVSTLFEDAAFQRCQFHVIQLVHKHLTRDPDHEAAKELLHILYGLKDAKTKDGEMRWKIEYKFWEASHEQLLKERTPAGKFRHGRLRSARLAVRNAWPHLFTFLDHENCPNTTNLVEGWVNAALAEALRRHRGLRLWQKQTLVSVILSDLRRNPKEKPTRKFT